MLQLPSRRINLEQRHCLTATPPKQAPGEKDNEKPIVVKGTVVQRSPARSTVPAASASTASSVVVPSQSIVQPSAVVEASSADVTKVLSSPAPLLNKDASKDESELSKFGLSSSDRILESYTCALYPKKGLGLTQGK